MSEVSIEFQLTLIDDIVNDTNTPINRNKDRLDPIPQ
jgi:hypothetical protein